MQRKEVVWGLFWTLILHHGVMARPLDKGHIKIRALSVEWVDSGRKPPLTMLLLITYSRTLRASILSQSCLEMAATQPSHVNVCSSFQVKVRSIQPGIEKVMLACLASSSLTTVQETSADTEPAASEANRGQHEEEGNSTISLG